MKQEIISTLMLTGLLASSAAAVTLSYTFESGLQGWTNNVPADSTLTEDMTTREADDGTWGTRIGSHGGGTFVVVEELDAARDATDDNVKLLSSPAFFLSNTTEISVWTLGGTGATAIAPTNYGAVLDEATAGGFMGIALRRLSDNAYVLADRRSGNGQLGRTINWLELGWDSTALNAQLTTDGASETYAVDLIDTFSDGWGWIAMDDVTFTNVTVVPEPSSTALLGLGGLALILRRRKA